MEFNLKPLYGGYKTYIKPPLHMEFNLKQSTLISVD